MDYEKCFEDVRQFSQPLPQLLCCGDSEDIILSNSGELQGAEEYGGITVRGSRLIGSRGITLGAFGGVAGFFALFFFSDVPRVRKDIMQVCQRLERNIEGRVLICGTESTGYWRAFRQGGPTVRQRTCYADILCSSKTAFCILKGRPTMVGAQQRVLSG